MVSSKGRYAVVASLVFSSVIVYYSIYSSNRLSVQEVPARLIHYFYDAPKEEALKEEGHNKGTDEEGPYEGNGKETEKDPYDYLSKITYPPAPVSSTESFAPTSTPHSKPKPDPRQHPIEDFIQTFNKAQDNVLKKPQATNLTEAAKLYRERRGRHPPPGFDKWFEYAEKQGGLLIEDFFDRIYRDISPFWGLPATQIRADIAISVASGEQVIRIRDGQVSQTKPDEGAYVYNSYNKMLQELQEYLPDVDVMINGMDEPRVLVEWEYKAELLAAAEKEKSIESLPTIHEYPSLPTDDSELADGREHAWDIEHPFWNIVRAGCPPDSPGRNASFEEPTGPAEFPDIWPNHSYKGFVSNWTLAKDPCQHPELRYLHGDLLRPFSVRSSNKLLSIFSRSKLSVNNDILLPAVAYWDYNVRFTLDESLILWNEKRNEVLWRGVASGGQNREDNWTRFHRPRLVSMLNGTTLRTVMEYLDTAKGKDKPSIPGNFPLPNQTLYPLQSFEDGILAIWIASVSNVGLVGMVCDPESTKGTDDTFACPYNRPWFQHPGEVPFPDFFKAKYLPDADGNSFSGRWEAYLHSNSVPLKATLYDEWHDDRLIPWVHFVPLDNTHMDLHAILEWLFLHDAEAERIGKSGSQWADKVLRKEDMLVYVYRLMLEFARVCSDEREKMGWAEDLEA